MGRRRGRAARRLPPRTGERAAVTSIGRGADGGDLAHRLYRRSPVRTARVGWQHRDVAANDVFFASSPRSGNGWLRFMALELVGLAAGFDAVKDAVPYVGRHSDA